MPPRRRQPSLTEVSGTWPDHVALYRFASIDSTNAEAARRAKTAPGPFWCIAEHQTAGRGRRGRAWRQGGQNFTASFCTCPDLSAAQLAQYSFVAALALFETLAQIGVPSDTLALKWPNDVLADGKKISGILLETVPTDRGLGIIVGIGVNIAAPPPQPDLEAGAMPAAAIADFGVEITADGVLSALAPIFSQWEAQFLRTGFAPIRAAWIARAMGIGSRITARLPNAEHVGVFEDVDENGALILGAAKGRLVLSAADVYF